MKLDKNKTYTVTQIANIAGVSKASVSRWLSERHVTPDHTKGKAKYFKSTYLEQYINAHTAPQNKASKAPTVVEVLQDQISQLKAENKRLTERIEKLDRQIEVKDQQIANWTAKSTMDSQLLNESHQLINESHQINKKLLESKSISADSDNERSSSINKVDNSSKENAEKPHQNWFQRHFGKK